MRGKSGADHTFDMLATRDDGLTVHRIAIGIEVSDTAVKLDRVFEFDDKAYDCSIQDKVLIVVPALGPEGQAFCRPAEDPGLRGQDHRAVAAASVSIVRDSGESSTRELSHCVLDSR